MALRNAKRIYVQNFFGLQLTSSEKNLGPEWWPAASEMVVAEDGSAELLRKPVVRASNASGVTGNPVLSMYEFTGYGGPIFMIDILNAMSTAVDTFYSTSVGWAGVAFSSSATLHRWKRLTLNSVAYGINGGEFVQEIYTTGNSIMRLPVGIIPPVNTPIISLTSGGSGSLASGVTVSYAYMDSTTGHVSAPSPASANSGPSGGNTMLNVGIVGTAQPGVDFVVLYVTEDNGSIRYLLIDTASNPVLLGNATYTATIPLDNLSYLDTLTPETVYNQPPPQDARFMFRYKDRVCLCDFPGATTKQQVQFNVYENCYFGIPWESWWPDNIINIPNKSDAARAGIDTPLGALILGEQDAYLIRGSLSDKISGPEAGISITEHMQSLNWSIGTKSPLTLVSTPYGEMWLDQHRRIQMWDHSGSPIEIGLPLRQFLVNIVSIDPVALASAEAVWRVDAQGTQGSQYVLAVPSLGSTLNDRIFIITVYMDPESGQTKFACAFSETDAQCIVNVTDAVSTFPCTLIGGVDVVSEFGPDYQGNEQGGTPGYFDVIVGADGAYALWSSIQFDVYQRNVVYNGLPVPLGLTVTISEVDGSHPKIIDIAPEKPVTEPGYSPYVGVLEEYGYRKRLRFLWDDNDLGKRTIQNLRVYYANTGRLI